MTRDEFFKILHLARASRASHRGRNLDSHTRTPEDLVYLRAIQAHLDRCAR